MTSIERQDIAGGQGELIRDPRLDVLIEVSPRAPARSVRRATARRASTRRATARHRKADTEASIVNFLAKHARSTAGELAKGLNLKPATVSAALAQLAKTGKVVRASRGYRTT